MSGANGIAAVTRTLVQLVQDGINRSGGDIARATVTTSRPDRSDANPQPRVNLFLFHAVPNPYLRNDDLPQRSPRGLIRRPAIGLDLYYLISFYGADEADRLETQALMGTTLATLNARPILTPEDMLRAAALFDTPVDRRFAFEQVQLTLHTISVEELSRLWGTFPQVPYALSVCYRASAVLIEADEIPAPALPVRGATPATAAALPPVIASVSGEGGTPPVYGGTLEILGRNFDGNRLVAVLGGAVLAAKPTGPGTLSVAATGRGMAAGIQPLHVACDGLLSGAVPLALAPAIGRITAELETDGDAEGSDTLRGTLHIGLKPAVQPGQAVTVDLFPFRSSATDDRRSYRFEWNDDDASDRGRSRLSIPVQAVAAGHYVVRVTVDGAPSVMTADATGRYAKPQIRLAPSRTGDAS